MIHLLVGINELIRIVNSLGLLATLSHWSAFSRHLLCTWLCLWCFRWWDLLSSRMEAFPTLAIAVAIATSLNGSASGSFLNPRNFMAVMRISSFPPAISAVAMSRPAVPSPSGRTRSAIRLVPVSFILPVGPPGLIAPGIDLSGPAISSTVVPSAVIVPIVSMAVSPVSCPRRCSGISSTLGMVSVPGDLLPSLGLKILVVDVP